MDLGKSISYAEYPGSRAAKNYTCASIIKRQMRNYRARSEIILRVPILPMKQYGPRIIAVGVRFSKRVSGWKHNGFLGGKPVDKTRMPFSKYVRITQWNSIAWCVRMRVTVDRSIAIYLSYCFFLNKSPQRITINYDDTICETPFIFGRESTIISLKTYWGFSHFDGVLFSRKHGFPSFARQGLKMGQTINRQ